MLDAERAIKNTQLQRNAFLISIVSKASGKEFINQIFGYGRMLVNRTARQGIAVIGPVL
jgi:ribosomal protein S17E